MVITYEDIRFAIGIHAAQVLHNVDEATVNEKIEFYTAQITKGIKDDFANPELLKAIIITQIKYFFWARMNPKDVPDHIREERKDANKLLEQIRSGQFRDADVSPSFTANDRYFSRKL